MKHNTASSRSSTIAKPQDKSRTRSVQRALCLLQAFSPRDPEWGVSELSRHLKLPKTVVFRLLETMRDACFVEQNPLNNRYRLGRAVYEIAANYASHNELIRIGDVFLHELVAKSHYTAQLGILDENQTVTLLVVESPLVVRISFRPGDRRLAYTSATGKVLLAEKSEESLRSLFPSRKLHCVTQNTITDFDALLKHLEQVRRQGYAMNRGESTEGIMAVAAPVRDSHGNPIAGISLGWPSQLVPQKEVPDLAQLVITTAGEMSKRLGDSGVRHDGHKSNRKKI